MIDALEISRTIYNIIFDSEPKNEVQIGEKLYSPPVTHLHTYSEVSIKQTGGAEFFPSHVSLHKIRVQGGAKRG